MGKIGPSASATPPSDPLGPTFIDDLNFGESYEVTLEFDNGGASANDQSWSYDDMTCVVVRWNDARNVILADPVPGNDYGSTDVPFTTNGTGALTGLPTNWGTGECNSGYSSVGFDATPEIAYGYEIYVIPNPSGGWTNDPFNLYQDQSCSFAGFGFKSMGADDGDWPTINQRSIQMVLENWSDPVPSVIPACDADTIAAQGFIDNSAVPVSQPVATLPFFSLLTLGGLLGLLGLRKLKK